MATKKVVNDILYEMDEAVGDAPNKYEIKYDSESRVFTVVDTESRDSACMFYSYKLAIKFIAIQILKDAAVKIDLSR